MSTKIYNGRIIRAPIGKAYDLLIRQKPAAVQIGRNLEIAFMANIAADKIDKARFDGEELDSPLFQAWNEMSDRVREIKKTQRRDPAVDFECELWLFPYKEQTLVIPNAEARELQSWFDNLPFVEDYAYWDNSDPDDNVDKKIWKQRERDWNKVLPGAGVPLDRCLVFSIHAGGAPYPADPEEAVKYIRSVEDRLEALARRLVIQDVYKAMLDEKQKEDPDWKPEGFGLYFKAEKELRSNPELLQAKKKAIQPFVREITAADLSYRS